MAKGYSLYSIQRFEEAVKAYDMALEINPDSEGTWLNKGMVFEHLQQPEAAKQCYEQIIKINPDNKDAKAGLERLG